MTAKTLKASEIILIKKSHLARLNSLGSTYIPSKVYEIQLKSKNKNAEEGGGRKRWERERAKKSAIMRE